jgi:urea carboxylase
VPLLEGSELLADSEEACRAAEAVGYPVMLKSTAGGGGLACASAATPAN